MTERLARAAVAAAALLAAPALAAAQQAAVRLPARFVADRVTVAPVLASGDTLLLYTDTGGGANMLWPATVDRLKLPVEVRAMGRDTARIVTLPPMSDAARIPLPNPVPPFQQSFLVFASPFDDPMSRDGFLGRTWFADRVWIFDYPAGTLSLAPNRPRPAAPGAHAVPLGFQTDSASGARTTHFPRIRVEIDGDSLDLLFDTGASVVLTDSARARFPGPAVRGTSFITDSVFERWRARHPDWTVIPNADRTIAGMPMIEVPLVSIGGHRVGPVWFTVRPERNFRVGMSRWMDRRIDGAIGGSALRYLRVTVDYPNAVAEFERP